MSSAVLAFRGWLRRTFAWSHSPRAWVELASLLGVLFAVAALVAYGPAHEVWQQALAWAGLAVAAAVLFRRGWLRLFGPVLWFDLVRTARRGRTYLVRAGYLLGLLLVLWLMYVNNAPSRFDGRDPSIHQLARFGQHFFWTFVAAQFAFVVLLTPAVTAGAIADEKQRQTLPFLLATDLTNGEIILGKLVSRFANVGLLLLAGLPVLGAVQLLGGVDPHLVLAAFAGTALTVASAAGVGVLASVFAHSGRSAIALAYGAVFAYVVLCALGEAALAFRWVTPRPYYAAAPFDPWDPVNLIEVVESGNPFVAVYRILNAGDSVDKVLLRALGAYALFHGVIAAACTAAATALLRRAARREPGPPRPRTAASRGGVGDWPMIWKEAHAHRGWRRWAGRLFVGLLVALSLWPLYYVWNDPYYTRPNTTFWPAWARAVNVWVRTVGTGLACLALLAVVVRAAFAIRVERERDTLDGLLTSPLSSAEILGGKWLGALLGARGLLLWLAAAWGFALLCGGMSLWAVPLLLLEWCTFAAAAAGVGLWFSLVSRTSLRAVVYTVLAGVVLWFGHWLIWLLCLPLGYRGGRGLDALVKFQAGLTPPAALAIAAFHPADLRDSFFGDAFPFLLCGVACWAGLAGLAWWATLKRFRREFSRD